MRTIRITIPNRCEPPRRTISSLIIASCRGFSVSNNVLVRQRGLTAVALRRRLFDLMRTGTLLVNDQGACNDGKRRNAVADFRYATAAISFAVRFDAGLFA